MSGYQMATTERAARMNHFRRELLPDSLSFYRNELGQVGRSNRAGWCACRCPFHNSKSGKSFAVHVDGAFVCRSCGISGGDVIAFIRRRDGLSFRDACQRLGCWEENGKRVSKPRPGPLVSFLRMDFVIDGVEHHAEVRDEPKTELQWLRRFYADAKDRLTELHDGNGETSEGEEEVQWGILANSWELIQMELGYAR